MSENFGLKIGLESENRYDRLKYYFNFRLPIELIILPRRQPRRDFSLQIIIKAGQQFNFAVFIQRYDIQAYPFKLDHHLIEISMPLSSKIVA
ncbi:MAG: hypothetical protein ACI4KM_08045 [Oscillospiraceae bacterium]